MATNNDFLNAYMQANELDEGLKDIARGAGDAIKNKVKNAWNNSTLGKLNARGKQIAADKKAKADQEKADATSAYDADNEAIDNFFNTAGQLLAKAYQNAAANQPSSEDNSQANSTTNNQSANEQQGSQK